LIQGKNNNLDSFACYTGKIAQGVSVKGSCRKNWVYFTKSVDSVPSRRWRSGPPTRSRAMAISAHHTSTTSKN